MWHSQLGVGRTDHSVPCDENEIRMKSKRTNESEKHGSAKKRIQSNNDVHTRIALDDISHMNNLPPKTEKNAKVNYNIET